VGFRAWPHGGSWLKTPLSHWPAGDAQARSHPFQARSISFPHKPISTESKKFHSGFAAPMVMTGGGCRMEQTPTTRPSLLLRLRDPHDERAWREFTDVYAPLVYRLARRKGLQDADAADLTQDVFRAVVRAFDNGAYDPARGSFRGWLFRVARNLAVNHLLRQARQPRGSGDSSVRDLLEAQPALGDDPALDAEYKRQLLYWAAEQVRGEFTELTWQAFWRTGVDGVAGAVVARELNTTVGAVYHCKSKVMARLKKKIEEVEGEDGLAADE
jgi:RNA polymerase sigma factor (sigma-70 family)